MIEAHICSHTPTLLRSIFSNRDQVLTIAQALKYDFVSLEDYLSGEQDIEMHSEFVVGQIYAMAGASRIHNMNALIETHLRAKRRVWNWI